MKMDTTKAMTVVVEQFEQDGGIVSDGVRGSQLPSKARKLRVALLYWLANVSESTRTSKPDDTGIKQLMGVSQECINFIGAVFLPNNGGNEQSSGEQMDAYSMVLWMLERYFVIRCTTDLHSEDILATIADIMKLLEDFDSKLFVDIFRRLSNFFQETVQIYTKEFCYATVKLAHQDFEFFTEDFDLKHCTLASSGVEFSNLKSVDRVVAHLLEIFSRSFTSVLMSCHPQCLFDIIRSVMLAMQSSKPGIKMKSLEFLICALPSLHKSLMMQSYPELEYFNFLLPAMFVDICGLIKLISCEETGQARDIVQKCIVLTSILAKTLLIDCCSAEAVSEIADTCIHFLLASPADDCLLMPEIVDSFIDIIQLSCRTLKTIFLSGRMSDLLELYVKKPPAWKSFSLSLRPIIRLMSIIQSNLAELPWIQMLEESDLNGIFSRPDSPCPVMPAKRLKTNDEPTAAITARSTVEFCKRYPMVGFMLQHFSDSLIKLGEQSETLRSTLLLASVVVNTINMLLNKQSESFFSGICRLVLTIIQTNLMQHLENLSPSRDAAPLFSFIEFYREVCMLQWPDKFFDASQALVFVGFTSMPWWSQQQTADLKLPPSFAKLISNATKTVNFDRCFLETALDCATFLSREYFPLWRSQVFAECFKSPQGFMVEYAILRFPMFLHVMGPASNSLVNDLLAQTVISNTENIQIMRHIASSLGPISCVISRQSALNRIQPIDIICSCQSDSAPENRSQQQSASGRAVSAAMFIPIVESLLSSSKNTESRVAIRRAVAESCGRIFSHVSFSQAESIELFKHTLLLLIDEDDVVRLLFAKSMAGVADVNDDLKTSVLEKVSMDDKTPNLRAYSNILAVSSLLINAKETKDSVFSTLLAYLVNNALVSMSHAVSCRLTGSAAENFLSDVVVRRNPDRPFMVYVDCSSDLAELISQKLITAAHNAHTLTNGDKERTRRRTLAAISIIFEILCRSFRFTDMEHCFNFVLPTVLPRLVISEADLLIKINVIELFAEQLRMSARSFLSDNIVRIWIFVLCHIGTAQAIEKTNDVARKVTRSNLDDMVARDSQKACFQLVSKMGINAKQAVRGLRFLAEHEQPAGQKLSDAQFAEFMNQRFLGILLYLDTQFQSNSISSAEKLALVAALCNLLTMMGASNVNTVRVKLLATLRIILRLKTKKFLEAALKAWNSFVKVLEPDNLAQMLPQILVSLLPLMKMFQGTLDSLFEIVFKTPVVVKCVDDISYIIVDVPEFAKHLKTMPDAAIIRRSPKSFAVACSRGCSNESSEVRMLALSRLKTYLTENQTNFMSNMGAYSLEHEWGGVLKQLLKCCHDTDINVRLMATEVFGLLGAIDPARIPSLQSNSPTCTKLTLSLNEVSTEPDFAYNLIMDVCRVFLAADDTKVQDAAAYAIQQLLATFGVNEALLTSSQIQGNGSFGIRLWNKFASSTQQLLKPYLRTKYVLTVKFDPSQVKIPFFGANDRFSQYKEWLCAFTHYLIQSLPNSSSTTTHASQLTNCFQACKAIVRYDAALALFLLPFISLHVVTNSQDNNGGNVSLANDIGIELQAVIDACVATNDHRLVVANNSVNSGVREGSNTPSSFALASQIQTYVSNQLPMAAQAAFIVIDHFTRWLEQATLRNAAHQQRAMYGASRRAQTDVLPPAVPLLQVESVANFLRRIPPLHLAIAAANCRYPARAMRYYEEHLASQPIGSVVVNNAGANFLQKLFMHLGEQDGVLGVAATFCQNPTVEQSILRHEINGQLSDALTCYEQAIEQQPDNFDFYRGVIGCLLSLGRDTAALHTVAGILGRQDDSIRSQVQMKFLPYQVEALGRLSDWSRLEACLKPIENINSSRNLEWPVGYWSAVVSLRKGDSAGFNESIAALRRAELGPLSAASLEAASYVRGYDSLVKMHVLAEMEMLAKYILGQSHCLPEQEKAGNSGKVAEMLTLLEDRLNVTEKSLAVREPLLQFRRLATKLLAEDVNTQMQTSLNARLGRLWLASARLARKAGRYESAYGHLLAANSYTEPGELRLETAKWLWARGSREDALGCLERWLSSRSGNAKDTLNARMLCLWTRYSEETAMLDSTTLIQKYRAVVESNSRAEEPYFYLAKYYSKLLMTAQDQPNPQPSSAVKTASNAGSDANTYLMEAVRNYGQSLRYGSKFIFESMPQLVSLWLDHALTVHNQMVSQQQPNSTLNQARTTMMQINQEIKALLGPIPAYQFLVVFPQLISRICHPQRETAAVLLEVAAFVMSTYPQQTTWLAMAVLRSMFPARKKRCEELFIRLRQMKSDLNQYLADITRLAERLCEVCDKSTDRDPDSDDSKLLPLSVSRDFRQMKRLVEEQSFSRILIPLQHLLWPTLPTRRPISSSPTGTAQHNPFPDDEIYFAGFGDEVEVMRSLQRPKRLLVRGSNGKLYGFLCKPKEDLRKDSRWMEYVTVVNSFLRRDPEASRRRLGIRTFAVIPLNEDCGIIEWVDHTHGIRPLIMQIYKERGIMKDQKFLISCKLPADAPLSEKLKVYKTRLLPAHPPVLGDWFRRNWFADASAWHEARLAFSRSAAVMSIAGYILGLGDRHGENILIDSKSGEVVHVDFSCLFNKADAFEYPEVVPFRLTHNMTHAMGPTGYEGVFRKACELTMRIARHHSDALMIVLKSFVHDPLVEWQKPQNAKNKRGPGETDGGEVFNSQAVKVLNDARNRLKGCVTASSMEMPLSIEGHVNYVIRQATDESNLAKMYIGWGPQL